jgi:hypothetical protein
MVQAMSKTLVKKNEPKGTVGHKKTVGYVVHKPKGGPWVLKEGSAVTGRCVKVVRGPSTARRKTSAYTPEEADWLNSLVHSAAKDTINKG